MFIVQVSWSFPIRKGFFYSLFVGDYMDDVDVEHVLFEKFPTMNEYDNCEYYGV
jgi:hypothetical protein